MVTKQTKTSIIIGLILGVFFGYLALSGVGFFIGSPFSIIGLEDLGRVIVTVVLAGIFEEIFFRFILSGVLMNFVPIFKGRFLLVNTTQAILFSLFHIAVYGSLIDKSALFISAVIFGFAMGVVLKFTNDDKWNYNMASTIIIHGIVNLAIIGPLLVVGL